LGSGARGRRRKKGGADPPPPGAARGHHPQKSAKLTIFRRALDVASDWQTCKNESLGGASAVRWRAFSEGTRPPAQEAYLQIFRDQPAQLELATKTLDQPHGSDIGRVGLPRWKNGLSDYYWARDTNFPCGGISVMRIDRGSL